MNILKGLVADESTPRNRLGVLCASVLGSNSSALSHVVDSNMHLSNEALIREWQSLPLEISEAHVPLLHNCQRLVEVREALKIVRKIAQSKKVSSVPDLKSVLSTWRERLPNKFDDTTAWSDIMRWRDHTFKYITRSFTPEDALRHQLHDAPWTVIKLAHIARRHGLQRVSLTVLNRLSSYRQMDIQDAFEKLREQILICFANAKKPLEIKSGIRFINDTNLEYFQSNLIGRSKKISQKAEFFRLKSKFLVALGETDSANENFSKCMRICDNFSKGWYTWACFLDKQYEKTGDIKVAAQAVCGFLQAVNHNTEGARLSLARVIWLMSNDDENGTIRETFQNYGDRMPLWIWCVWIPQLLTALIRDEASKVRSILLHISTVYPQALYYTLRAFLLEKRELPLSSPKDEETKEEDNTKKRKKKRLDSVKYAEDLMARLRSYHPALASEIERMLEEIIVKFKPAPQEELESAVHALLSKCFQLPMSTNSIPESLQNTLRRVCVKFFSEETSKKSERHRLFVAEYKVPFERDLFPVNNDRFPKTLDEVVKKLNTWKNILTRRVQSEPKSVAMGLCSQYLEEYRSNVVEIPGLYNTSSDSEPRPKLHPRLQSFSQRVDIIHSHGYSSRRLTAIGSNGKRYHFLVQFAVPSLTRQDERMVQLRVIANRLMNRSSGT